MLVLQTLKKFISQHLEGKIKGKRSHIIGFGVFVFSLVLGLSPEPTFCYICVLPSVILKGLQLFMF